MVDHFGGLMGPIPIHDRLATTGAVLRSLLHADAADRGIFGWSYRGRTFPLHDLCGLSARCQWSGGISAIDGHRHRTASERAVIMFSHGHQRSGCDDDFMEFIVLRRCYTNDPARDANPADPSDRRGWLPRKCICNRWR
jgi:hypothetical protein